MMYNRRKYLLIFLFLCFAGGSVHAEELTWEECVRESRENHPDLVSAEEKLNQSKFSKDVTASNLLPQINSSLSQNTSKTEDTAQSDSYSYGVTGKQLLFDGLKTSYNVKAASENIRATEYDYMVTSSNIRLKLMTAFVELLKAQELLNITEEIAGRRRQNVELVKLRYEAGREHKGSLLTAEANLAQAEYEVLSARRNIELSQRQLIKELGRDKLTPISVKGAFEVKYSERNKPDFENLSSITPFLQELIAKKEAVRFGLKSAKADFFPQIYANTSAGRTSSDWPPDKDEWSIGVSLSLPLFEGGRRKSEVSRNKALFNQAQADERSGRNNVIFTLEDTWTGFQNSIDRVDVQRKFLEASDERAKIAQAQYSTGLITFDNWTIIEDDLVKAKKSFLDVQSDALISEAEWLQAKGETLDYDK